MGAITFLAIFCTGASLFASLLALSACVLSARISQTEDKTPELTRLTGSRSPVKFEPVSQGD